MVGHPTNDLYIATSKLSWMNNQILGGLKNSNQDIGKDMVIVGEGITGLPYIYYSCSSGGRCVTVIERSSELGDRAGTSLVNSFYLNQSPQADYSASPSFRDLRELGNSYSGSTIDR
jgi:hypothetical protein